MDMLDFSYVERHIVFKAKVNDAIPINVLMDTGAGQSALFEKVAKRLGLVKQDTSEEVKAIAGSQGQIATTVFSSLKICVLWGQIFAFYIFTLNDKFGYG